jgi:hypothetical protein
MRKSALICLTLTACASCTSLPTNTAVDRLKQPAAAHARALAGDDAPMMRESGLVLLTMLEAYAGW